MTELRDWYLTQLGEAEQEADYIHADDCSCVVVDYDDGSSQRMVGSCNCGMPQYLRADIEAKRRILDQVADRLPANPEHDEPEYAYGYARAMHDAARLLALPYTSRPGYRDEWRPGMSRMVFDGGIEDWPGPLVPVDPADVPHDLVVCALCGATLWLADHTDVEHDCATGEVRPV